MKPHIADAEASPFVVINIEPDFCCVDGEVVAFEIYQELQSEKAAYAPDVMARKGRVLTKGSVIRGVIGNAGEGVVSGRSRGSGHCVVEEGDEMVRANGEPVARHGHLCAMNVDI